MTTKIKIGIISGSHRPHAQSDRVALYFEKQLNAIGCATHLLSLGKTPLPLWQEAVVLTSQQREFWQKNSHALQECSGFVIISPEWGGMATPAIKNFFLFCSNKELSHKPGLLVSVSASINGCYPISDLRASSYKNTKIVYLPEHIILRNIASILNDDAAKNDPRQQDYMKERIDNALQMLVAYGEGLAPFRQSIAYQTDCQKFPNGM